MVDISRDELLSVLKDSKLVSSPGEDEVSAGVWKLAIIGSERTCSLILSLFNSCLHTSCFPMPGSHILMPFFKDIHKERAMSNIRPISLQSSFGPLLTPILAYRLGNIFATHPILNSAQFGFVLAGSTTKCIDKLLDAWDWGRNHKKELYTLFYDIKQAYDSVQVDVLRRALKRIHLPSFLIELITNSLTGLSSCVRTMYGTTRPFPVLRSLRQGDPLAPCSLSFSWMLYTMVWR